MRLVLYSKLGRRKEIQWNHAPPKVIEAARIPPDDFDPEPPMTTPPSNRVLFLRTPAMRDASGEVLGRGSFVIYEEQGSWA